MSVLTFKLNDSHWLCCLKTISPCLRTFCRSCCLLHSRHNGLKRNLVFFSEKTCTDYYVHSHCLTMWAYSTWTLSHALRQHDTFFQRICTSKAVKQFPVKPHNLPTSHTKHNYEMNATEMKKVAEVETIKTEMFVEIQA